MYFRLKVRLDIKSKTCIPIGKYGHSLDLRLGLTLSLKHACKTTYVLLNLGLRFGLMSSLKHALMVHFRLKVRPNAKSKPWKHN